MILDDFMNDVYLDYSNLGQKCEDDNRCQMCRGDCAECQKCDWNMYDGNTEHARRYDCDNFKRVYMIRYMAAHVENAKIPLQKVDELSSFIAGSDVIRTVSLGGAYGNESIAVLDYLNDNGLAPAVRLWTLDKTPSWEPFHDHVVEGFASRTSISERLLGFISEDATRPAQIMRIASSAPVHLAFVPWVLSEKGNDNLARALLQTAIDLVGNWGFVIITDRTESKLVDKVNCLINQFHGVRIVYHERYCSRPISVQIPPEIRVRFGPKCNAVTAYWVLQSSNLGYTG